MNHSEARGVFCNGHLISELILVIFNNFTFPYLMSKNTHPQAQKFYWNGKAADTKINQM